jgi:hypothetical protein
VERERLHESGSELELERNRREIVSMQQHICHAFLAAAQAR